MQCRRQGHQLRLLFLTGLLALAACAGEREEGRPLSDADVAAVRAVSDAYVRAWLDDDTLGVLNTLDPEAVLMPAGMKPLVGLEAIRAFWWPDDGSRTVVTAYTLEVEEVGGEGGLAYTRGQADLAFTYEKDGPKTEQTNTTMDLTVYCRQPDGTWRMLRRMWAPLRR